MRFHAALQRYPSNGMLCIDQHAFDTTDSILNPYYYRTSWASAKTCLLLGTTCRKEVLSLRKVTALPLQAVQGYVYQAHFN